MFDFITSDIAELIENFDYHKFPEETAKQIYKLVAQSLEWMHSQKIIHGDIKPGE